MIRADKFDRLLAPPRTASVPVRRFRPNSPRHVLRADTARDQATTTHAARMPHPADTARHRASRDSPVMVRTVVRTTRTGWHRPCWLRADKVDLSRRVRSARRSLAQRPTCAGSRGKAHLEHKAKPERDMRPLTPRCGRYHERACGANRQWSTRAFPAGVL